MKITISPSALAQQLPELRTQIIQTYEDNLTIEGGENTSVTERKYPIGSKEERFPVLIDHPEFIHIFPVSRQLAIVNSIWKTEKTVEDLMFDIYGDVRFYKNKKYPKRKINGCNLIYVMFKCIRKKIKDHNIPFEIKKMGGCPNYFTFVEKI